MSALSNRINNLSESATIKMAKLGRELAAKGVDVISLSFGEPDFHTPEHIKEAAKKVRDEYEKRKREIDQLLGPSQIPSNHLSQTYGNVQASSHPAFLLYRHFEAVICHLLFVILLCASRLQSELGKPPHLLTQKGPLLLPVGP